jgi:hypothetical protein
MPFTLEEVEDILEPVAGATILGELDQPLRVQYSELVDIETELADRTDAMRKVMFGNISSRLQDEWDGSPDQTWLRKLGEEAPFANEEEAYSYYELIARWEEANTAFWYACKLTCKGFNDTCQIRQGFKVVSLGKKFKK